MLRSLSLSLPLLLASACSMLDWDGDGISHAEENELGTNPRRPIPMVTASMIPRKSTMERIPSPKIRTEMDSTTVQKKMKERTPWWQTVMGTV